MTTYKLTVFPYEGNEQCEFSYTDRQEYLEHLEEAIMLDLLISHEEQTK